MIPGFATEDGTAGYRDRFAGAAAPTNFRPAHGLWWSSIGIGTYLGDMDAANARVTHEPVKELDLDRREVFGRGHGSAPVA